jgi:ribosomal protein S18 acetylase RimI-like enzyme
MEIVKCSKKYWEFVRTLRNNEKVQEGFIETIEITPEMQEKYMNKYNECYRVVLAEVHVGDSLSKVPVGFVGVIENDIRVCTHPNFQGRGYGKFMINECMKIWPNAFAKVKIKNKASLKLFESCGFNKKYYILKR